MEETGLGRFGPILPCQRPGPPPRPRKSFPPPAIRPQPSPPTTTRDPGPSLAGDTLHFNVRFLITPFKPIDTRTHFDTRFVHQYVPVDSVTAWGGTVVNIHHANEINPYINYPFFNLDLQTAYIDEAHAQGDQGQALQHDS